MAHTLTFDNSVTPYVNGKPGTSGMKLHNGDTITVSWEYFWLKVNGKDYEGYDETITITDSNINLSEGAYSSDFDAASLTINFVDTSVVRLSVDVSTLTGWDTLAAGAHNITIVAKAAGFKDSAPSAAVQVTKAASTKTLAAGTYKWVDAPSLPSNTIKTVFDFTIDDGEDIPQYGILAILGELQYFQATGGVSPLSVYRSSGWSTNAYKTITLATDQQVSADFYEWAITGGNLVKQAVDNGITTDTPAYSFNVDFNAAPGQNVSETSNQAYEAVQNYINETGGSSEYAILGALYAISPELKDEFDSVLEFGNNIKNRIRDIGDLQVPSGGDVTCACDVYAVYFGVYNNGSWTVAIPTSSTEGWQMHLSATGSTPIVMVTVTQ